MILAASEAGNGPTLVLLHGLFGRRQNFATLAKRLAAEFRVISLDLRNHGESPHAAEMGYALMAEDVRETLAAMGALPAAVLGHSMGGKTAMMLALAHPGEVRRLLVADIAPVAYAHHNRAVAAAMQAIPLVPGLARREAEHLLEEAVPSAPVRAFLVQNLVFGEAPRWRIGLDAIAAAIPALESWPEPPPGRAFGGPTLFLRGETSDFVPDTARPAILARFPAAQIETLAGAGHWLHADRPDAFHDAARTFLAPLLRT